MNALPRSIGVVLVVLWGCQERSPQGAPSAAPSTTTSGSVSTAAPSSALPPSATAAVSAAPPAPSAPPSAAPSATVAKGPPCGMKTDDWCASPPGDPCGVHKDLKSCRADKKCRGQFYSGESFVACKDDGTGFPSNCPTVGCLSR